MAFKHLIGLQEISKEDIEAILDLAASFKEIILRPIKKVPSLKGKTVVNMFFEPSTRTRTSFELAAKRLSADAVNLTIATSSVVKGETLLDTVKTIEAMQIDIVIIRHGVSGVPLYLSQRIKSSVINAGDGMHEHPTQGLLDIFTIREKKGKIAGLKVAIVGDITHSRVARSNIWGLTKLGADVRVIGPSTLIPKDIEKLGVKVFTDVESGIKDVDVINILRLQLERQKKNLFPTIREYAMLFGINTEKLKLAKPDCLVLHPGPMNRGIEISPNVADGSHSVIEEQVTNGVAVRMAVLYLIGGGKKNDENAD
ncbi:MAG: aspartate carbamoyltransferase catalytic subunit [Candidatus Goldbacteria bacterium]|nr:aspartate carbamoyltransferase catalytic subunit [Candidatus Goldiibacteriota bacterium]HPD18629.1 aspartate carbamoyltransferase catalytic subunit [Candidatus Goldiibacteriota bacterium]